jgi:hypothetical protein
MERRQTMPVLANVLLFVTPVAILSMGTALAEGVAVAGL